jgi:hypothetical protein
VKPQERNSQRSFDIRCKSRAARMRNLVELFQTRQIDVKRFRRLTTDLKAEHRQDCRTTGLRFDTPTLT